MSEVSHIDSVKIKSYSKVGMLRTLKWDKLSLAAAVLFALLTLWWILLLVSGSKEGFNNLLFGAVYGTSMSIFGGVIGLYSAKLWGGWKSIMGKAVIVLSLGLLAETFGQLIFSYYNLFANIDIPYPSLADIGYFGNIPLYICGVVLLANVVGIKSRVRHWRSQLISTAIVGLLLALSYYLFLLNYEFDFNQPVKILLDFGYPLGQAFYVSLAIVTYLLSRNYLGGIMKGPVVVLILAFIAQYAADYNFLSQASTGTWYNGGYGDYLYLVAYFAMTLGLIKIRRAALKIAGKI